jgi:hypothetical protein
MIINNKMVVCLVVYDIFMNFYGNNENTSVKMVSLSVIQNYLILTVSLENTAVNFVMIEDWETCYKKYQNSSREMSQITSPSPFLFLLPHVTIQNSAAPSFPQMPIIKVT